MNRECKSWNWAKGGRAVMHNARQSLGDDTESRWRGGRTKSWERRRSRKWEVWEDCSKELQNHEELRWSGRESDKERGDNVQEQWGLLMPEREAMMCCLKVWASRLQFLEERKGNWFRICNKEQRDYLPRGQAQWYEDWLRTSLPLAGVVGRAVLWAFSNAEK